MRFFFIFFFNGLKVFQIDRKINEKKKSSITQKKKKKKLMNWLINFRGVHRNFRRKEILTKASKNLVL